MFISVDLRNTFKSFYVTGVFLLSPKINRKETFSQITITKRDVYHSNSDKFLIVAVRQLAGSFQVVPTRPGNPALYKAKIDV